MTETVYQAIRERAKELGDSPALLAPGKADSTFRQLLERTEAMRLELARFGVRRGTRIGILARTRDVMAAAHLAVIFSATSAPLSAHSATRELEFCIADFGLEILLIEQGMEDLKNVALSSGVKVLTLHPNEEKAGFFGISGEIAEATPVLDSPTPDDVAILLHTSGTTSRPKVVPKTQRRLVSNLDRDRGDTQLRQGDRVLNVLPLHHTEGLHQFTMPLLLGASVVIADFKPSIDAPDGHRYGKRKAGHVHGHQSAVRRNVVSGTARQTSPTNGAGLWRSCCRGLRSNRSGWNG